MPNAQAETANPELLETTHRVACPACSDPSPATIGTLAKLEGLISLADPGVLFHCTVCGLFFRRPYLSDDELTRAYSELKPDTWPSTSRHDFAIAARTIGRWPGVRKILDVGCFRGDFLAMLPDSIQRYGIEPSHEIRPLAAGNRVTIVAETIEAMSAQWSNFDVIAMIDVIEHLPRPLEALKKLARHLAPGGRFVIATGNTDVLPWRMMRLNYWYYFPEHVSFFNAKWFRWAANRLGLALTETHNFSHESAGWGLKLRQIGYAATYQLYAKLAPLGFVQTGLSHVYPFTRVSHGSPLPQTRAWEDHFLVCLQSRQTGSQE